MPIRLPIETERLLVRPFVPEADSKPMLAVYGDPEVMRYIPGGALSAEAVLHAVKARRRRSEGYSGAYLSYPNDD